jgi:putative mRNA 3-end processing factor
VTWRDGVHLTGTPIWCDARRRRDVCFASAAERPGRAAHGQLIGTPLTLALLGARGGGHLAVPLYRRFTLGTLSLELIASGRGPGAAALAVEAGGRRVLYAGAIRTAVPGAGYALSTEPAGVRACDALVVAAPFGEERFSFPPLAEAAATTCDWVRARLAAGDHPALLVDTPLDALEIAARLAAEGLPLAGDRPIRELARRVAALARAGGVDAAAATRARRDAELRGAPVEAPAPGPPPSAAPPQAMPTIAAPGRAPRATLWLAADARGLARTLGDRARHVAHVSGHAVDAPASTAAFAWSSAADRRELLPWIEATGARTVFVTGAGAESVAAALGPRARALGPPRQMALFEAG